MSFTDDTIIHFTARQITPSGIREIAIYKIPGGASWVLSRADVADTDEEPQFIEDETHEHLYAAYTSLIQSHLSVPYPL